jgi:hypothetical protein
VFVSVVCSIQYRVVRQNADDAFYELQNPREQIQSYVFDGCYSEYHFTIVASLLLSHCNMLAFFYNNELSLYLLSDTRRFQTANFDPLFLKLDCLK